MGITTVGKGVVWLIRERNPGELGRIGPFEFEIIDSIREDGTEVAITGPNDENGTGFGLVVENLGISPLGLMP